MSESLPAADRPKKDRSPSFPFVSLRKAVERAEQFATAHKRDAARLPTVAPTWGYGAKSSGLLQTAAALKQYGLVEDVGAGEDRKIRLTDLARSIISDTRPGVKQSALQTAARNPKLFAEYIDRWVPDSPADGHCVSELEHDRGFTPDAAKSFLRAFKLTVAYAGLMARDSLSSGSDQSAEPGESEMNAEPNGGAATPAHAPSIPAAPQAETAPDHDTALPFRRRYKVTMADNKLTITATLVAPSEVDKLVRLLEANKALLDDFDGDDTGTEPG